MVKYFVFIFFPVIIHSQVTISGRILNNNNSPLDGASIQIFNKDTSKILDFSISGKEGKWTASISKFADIIISVRYLGYRDIIKGYSINKPDTVLPDFILYPYNFHLKEVIIKAKKIDFVIDGDTISYKVDPVRDSTDFYVEDILKKLPDFEIRENTSIFYKGKKVDKVLVEGKDLHDNRQKFFLQSFTPKDVDKIEIIRHYKDMADKFNKSQSDKTALNIKLKKGALNKIKFITETSAGYDKKYSHSSNIYYIKNHLGINSYLKLNNKGESDLSLMDFLRLQIPPIETLIDNGMKSIIPPGFMMPNDLSGNFDIVCAFNTEYKKKKNNNIKFSILSAYLKRNSSSRLNRNYIYSNTVLLGDKIGNSVFNAIDESFSVTKFYKKILFGFRFPLRYVKSSGVKNFQDIILNEYFTNYKEKYLNLKSSPNLKLTYKLYDDIMILMNYDIRYENRNAKNNYSDFSPDTILYIKNHVENTGFNHNVSLHIKHVSNKNLIIDVFQKYISVNKKFISKTDNHFGLLEANSKLKDNIFSLNVHIGNNYGKIRFLNKFELIQNHKRILNDYSNEFTYFNDNFYIGYNFSELNYTGLSIYFKNSLFGFNEISNTSYLNECRTITIGGISPDVLRKIKGLSLSYVNMDNSKSFSSINTFSYTVTDNPVIYENSFEEGFNILRKSIGKQSKTINLISNFNKSFKSKFKRININLKYNNTKISKENQIKIQNLNFEYKIKLFFEISSYMKFIAGYEFNFTNQNISDKNFNFKAHKPDLEFEIKNKKFMLNNKFSFENNIYLKDKLVYPLWSLDLRYFINSGFSLFIKGKDILNLKGRKFRSLKVTEQYIEVSNYMKFPGYILIGVYYTN